MVLAKPPLAATAFAAAIGSSVAGSGDSLSLADLRRFHSPLQAKLQISPNPPWKTLAGLDPSPPTSRARIPLPRSERGWSDARASSDPHSWSEESDSPLHSSSGLLRRASLIGAATVASKILGLLREVFLAAVIGVGPVATAFNHAAVLPRFSSSFLGGVNGPIHITAATTLSKLARESRGHVIQKTHTLMLVLGVILAALTYSYGEHIISVSAPGLGVLAEGQMIRQMASTQLKLMTPCIVVAGSMGICFGSLTAEGIDIIPCLSPSVTSVAIMLSCVVYVLTKGSSMPNLSTALLGELISSAASIGTLLQWIILVMIHEKSGFWSNSFSWIDYFKDKTVHKLFALMLPAIFSSGLAQIISLTDMYFSSFIPRAAAGLSYAHLLAMAPLGLLSSTIVLPMLPVFSKLAKSSSLESLKKNLQDTILMCLVIILPITCNICVLSRPIVSVLFQRLIFDSTATTFVSSLLLCYSVGSPFWVIRELYAAVFYSLGDGYLPFTVSLAGVLLNIMLDWFSVTVVGLGAQGVALSTSCVMALSVVALMLLLTNKLQGTFNMRELSGPILLLLACCIVSGSTTMISYRMLQFSLSSFLMLRFCRLDEIIGISIAGFMGISAFYLSLLFMPFSEGMLLSNELKTLLSRLRWKRVLMSRKGNRNNIPITKGILS